MIQHQPGVTRLIDNWQNGDENAGHAALAMVYGELRRLARRLIDREAPGHTLEPTALVHEAYLRLIDQRNPTSELVEEGAAAWTPWSSGAASVRSVFWKWTPR